MSQMERWWRVTPNHPEHRSVWVQEQPSLVGAWEGADVAGPFALESARADELVVALEAATKRIDALEAALRALVVDIEDYGEPRKHKRAMTMARAALDAKVAA